MQYETTIFYKYTPVADPVSFMDWQRQTCENIGILGRILIAKEGINGTVEGTPEQLAEYSQRMHAQDGKAGTFGDFSDVWFKNSPSQGNSFKKLKIKVRNEIVTLGIPDLDPTKTTGTPIPVSQLKEWIEKQEDFEIIDMRNAFEYAVGHFKGSHNPGLTNFKDLSKALPNLEHLKEKKVLTVCTYGVRCEKASAYLKQQGFKDVYQLQGGIGTYMKAYPGQDFLGSLYVFDQRITEQFVKEYDVIGTCTQCHQISERFGNCALDSCHKQLIICESCADTDVYCSKKCKEKHI